MGGRWWCPDLSWSYPFLWSSASIHPLGVFEQDSGILLGVLVDWQTFICPSWTQAFSHWMLIACPLPFSHLFSPVVQVGSFPCGSKILNWVFLLLLITILLDHLWALLVEDLLLFGNNLSLLWGRAWSYATPLAWRAISKSTTALQLSLWLCWHQAGFATHFWVTVMWQSWASALIWKIHPTQSQ